MVWYLRPVSSSSTYPFARALGQIVIAPFTKVTFLASYVADVLTSLVKVYFDIWYGLCWTLGGYWLGNGIDGANEAIAQCSHSSLAINVPSTSIQ